MFPPVFLLFSSFFFCSGENDRSVALDRTSESPRIVIVTHTVLSFQADSHPPLGSDQKVAKFDDFLCFSCSCSSSSRRFVFTAEPRLHYRAPSRQTLRPVFQRRANKKTMKHKVLSNLSAAHATRVWSLWFCSRRPSR